jgi:hypothetical protein
MEMHISPPSAEKAKEDLVQKREQHDKDYFDPMGSIFLPKTEYYEREFADWEVAIMMRRGILFPNTTSMTESFQYQQELYEELVMVRSWYMGQRAVEQLIVA